MAASAYGQASALSAWTAIAMMTKWMTPDSNAGCFKRADLNVIVLVRGCRSRG